MHRQDSGENISDVNERGDKKYFLYAFVLALDYYEPDDDCANRNGDVFGESKKFKAAGDPGKFAEDVAEVDEEDGEHHEKGDAKTEFLADQVAQSFAGDCAHACGNFLDHDERHGDRNHG